MRKVISGDSGAFRLLIDKYRNYLFQVVYPIVSHPKDAEDVAQEAFVQIFLSLPDYEFQGFKTWMTRIAVNKAIDFKRRERRRGRVETIPHEQADFSTGIDEAEDRYLREERRNRLLQRLSELPEPYRDVIYAFYIEEKTYQEIARRTGLAVKTVESRLYRARQWIRAHWKEEDFR